MGIIQYHCGYDHFTPDPGKWESKRCEACGTECDVKRSYVGKRTRWGSSDSVFDIFTCPNAGLYWHTHIIQILEAIRDMPSPRVAALMKKDVADILKENS